MNHLLSILLTAILCASASAQTIKTLGYNTTNGQVVVATNVVWTNSFNFSTNTIAASVRANLGFSTNLNTLWTATNATTAANALGLGETPDGGGFAPQAAISIWDNTLQEQGLYVDDGDPVFGSQGAGPWRSALGLPLAALTNTSNVTMMRALAGVTNGPVTDSITLSDGGTSWTLTFSNGILVNITEL